MEDAVSDPRADTLLPSAVDVPFQEIESALADVGRASRTGHATPALTATIVVLGPRERLAEAASALQPMTDAGGLRMILIASGTDSTPAVRVSSQAIALEGLRSEYVNNAIAALRLSSLPTMVWWRGGEPAALEGLAALADRLVLDAEDPVAAWATVPVLAEQVAVSDLRWTRLTRWRALLAHFFDIEEVRAAAPGLRRLEIAATDRHAGRLFGAWLKSSLNWNGSVSIVPGSTRSSASIERVRFGDDEQALTLRLAPHSTCVEAMARVKGHSDVVRTVSLGDQGLRALIAEELRIRSRDVPFERALRTMEGMAS
jgi:glucose-6-phosphate dehydrogenase assembly protein OpcA